MAETEAMIGWSTKFEIDLAASGVDWQEIAEVYDISAPSFTIDEIDATHMQSPNRTREFIAGLTDPGECSFEMNFIPGSDSDVLLQRIRSTGEQVTCRITFPNDVTWTFTGILRTYEPSIPTADKMTATVTFRVSGSIVTGVESG